SFRREHAREGPGPTADVEHRPGIDLARDGCIDVEVATVRVERVVDRRQPRLVEDPIRHHTTVARRPRDGRVKSIERGESIGTLPAAAPPRLIAQGRATKSRSTGQAVRSWTMNKWP